jgi:hypothetical protein
MKEVLCLIMVICGIRATAQQHSSELQKLEIKEKKLEIKKLALEIKEEKLTLRHEKNAWSKTYLDRSKFFLSFGMGGSIPLQNSANSLINSLVINNKGFYIQFLSATLFLHKNWGVEVSVKMNPGGNTTSLYDTIYGYKTPFNNQLQSMYGDRYFVSSTQVNWDAGPNVNLMAGPVYKIIKGRFMFMPKLLFGMNTFGFNEGYAYLKEKNGNEIIDKSFIPSSSNKTSFAISPGFTGSFRFAKKWAANIDVNYYRSSVSNSYTEKTFNYKTQTGSSAMINQSIVTQWVNVGAGISLLIK